MLAFFRQGTYFFVQRWAGGSAPGARGVGENGQHGRLMFFLGQNPFACMAFDTWKGGGTPKHTKEAQENDATLQPVGCFFFFFSSPYNYDVVGCTTSSLLFFLVIFLSPITTYCPQWPSWAGGN